MANLINGYVNVLQEIKAHTKDVTCVEFYGNSLLFTGSSDKTVRVWKWCVGKGFIEESFSPLLGHKYGVTSVKVSPQGGVLASSSVDGTIALWDISTGKRMNVLSQEGGEAVRSCAFSPNGSYIISSDDSGTICVWGQNRNLIKVIRCHEEAVHTIAFSPDSSVLLTGCSLGNVRLFSFNENYDDHVSEIPDCSIDGAHDLGILSADFCRLVHTDPSDHDTCIYTLATCGTDHLIKVWRVFYAKNIESRGTFKSRLLPTSPQEHCTDGSTIYCTAVMNIECVLNILAHGSSVTCIKFNYTGTMMISASLDKSIKLWDLQGTCLSTLAEHSRYINSVTINNDSTIIASGSNDKSVLIWDLTSNFTIDSQLTSARSLLFNMASNKTDMPLEFICPITHEIMRNPVVAEDGFSYENSALQEWFETGKKTSPMTNGILSSVEVMENTLLKDKIEEFLKALDFDNTFE